MNAINVLFLLLTALFRILKGSTTFSNPLDHSILNIESLSEEKRLLEQSHTLEAPTVAITQKSCKFGSIVNSAFSKPLGIRKNIHNSCTRTVIALPIHELVEQYELLKSATDTIEANEIIIAAVRMRSIVPDYIIDIEHFRRDGDSEYLDRKSRTSRMHIIDSLNRLIHALPQDVFTSALNEIVAFDFNESLDEFAAQKEAGIAQKFAESFAIIRQIQQIFHSNSSISPENLTLDILLNIVNDLNYINLHCASILRYQDDECPKNQSMKFMTIYQKLLKDRLQKMAQVLNTLILYEKIERDLLINKNNFENEG